MKKISDNDLVDQMRVFKRKYQITRNIFSADKSMSYFTTVIKRSASCNAIYEEIRKKILQNRYDKIYGSRKKI